MITESGASGPVDEVPAAAVGPGLQSHAVKGAAWALMQTWGARVMTLVVVTILSRLLDATDFGLVALGSVFVEFGYWLADGGFGKALVARAEIDEDLVSTAFWTAVGISLSLCAGLILGAPLIAHAMDEPRLTPVIRLLSLNYVFIAAGSTPLALLQRELKFKSIALRQLLSTLAGAITGCTLAFAGKGVYALVSQTLASGICSLVVLWASTKWRPKLRFRKTYFNEMFSFGSKVMGTEVLSFAGRRGDDFLIGALLGPTQLGYYTIAFRYLTIVVELMTGSLGSVVFPVFSRMQGDQKRTTRTYLGVVRMSATLALPTFLGMATLAPEILATVSGSKWLPSVPAMRVLCMAGCLYSVSYFYRDLLLSNGKANWVLRYMAFTIPALMLSFAVGAQWGIFGVAVAGTVAHFAIHPIDLAMVRKVAPFRLAQYVQQFFRPLFCALLMVASLSFGRSFLGTEMESVPRLILLVAFGAAIYAAGLLLFARALCAELLFHAAQLEPLKGVLRRLDLAQRLRLPSPGL